MSVANNRSKFSTEFRIEAAHRVIDSERRVAEAARDLSLPEATLRTWVRNVCRRIEAAKASNAEPLEANESTELVRLRKQVAE